MFWLRSILFFSTLSYLVIAHAISGQHQKISPESVMLSQAVEVSQPINQKQTSLSSPEMKALLEQAKQLEKQVTELSQQGHYEKAIPIAEQVIGIRKRILGENHPDYVESLNNLAALYYSMADSTRAKPLFKQALAIRKKVLGEKPSRLCYQFKNFSSQETP